VVTSFADLSHYQESVDLAAYARAGHDRVILKATEGLSVVDSRFAERWQQAGRLGLARVAYHFGRAGNSGAAEFDHLLQVVGGLGARDVLCLDSEDTGAASRAAAHAREFTARAVARGVRTGLVYTGRWFAEPNGITAAVVQPGWRQLWLSDYGTAADAGIALPTGWSRAQLVARQFTDHASVAGIAGGCDYNRLLRDWLSRPITRPAPPPANPMEDDVPPIMVYAQGSPLYLYWPATATLVGVGDPTERDTLKKVHAEAGQPIDEIKLAPGELEQLVEFTRRVRSQVS
jgi:GH25 family lysozyme M1 (1,4-beta-N-acetylmuramidase)